MALLYCGSSLPSNSESWARPDNGLILDISGVDQRPAMHSVRAVIFQCLDCGPLRLPCSQEGFRWVNYEAMSWRVSEAHSKKVGGKGLHKWVFSWCQHPEHALEFVLRASPEVSLVSLRAMVSHPAIHISAWNHHHCNTSNAHGSKKEEDLEPGGTSL